MVTVEIVVVGNEVLQGDVLDTNSNWLSKRLVGLGGSIGRVVVVRDIVGEIAGEVRRSLGRGAGLVVTAGGLGPTADDLTLRGVAAAAGVPLELNADAREMVAARYRELHDARKIANPTLTPEREKM